ncbi:MAG: hypothetical protein NTZ80_02280 [Patescibacteria group bacterium]|nr:hypothetical protein [Patescibacteria group bacterium]
MKKYLLFCLLVVALCATTVFGNVMAADVGPGYYAFGESNSQGDAITGIMVGNWWNTYCKLMTISTGTTIINHPLTQEATDNANTYTMDVRGKTIGLEETSSVWTNEAGGNNVGAYHYGGVFSNVIVAATDYAASNEACTMSTTGSKCTDAKDTGPGWKWLNNNYTKMDIPG